jgi:hypothetical protein
MECDICGKSTPLLHCVTCARTAVELTRIQLALRLVDHDAVAKHVKAVVEGSDDKLNQHLSLNDSRGGLLVDRHECTKSFDLQRTKAETTEVEDRISLITEQAALLRDEMEIARRELEKRKAVIAQRKSDLSSATYGIESRRANELDKIVQNHKRMMYKSDKVHLETIEVRMYLCSTAAKLAGLKMTRWKTKDGGIREVYYLGPGSFLRVYDLRELNDPKFDQLSASLGAVAQLLIRVSHYLGVRLPAEITAPHKDYPQPTIFNLSSSYMGQKVPFPGTTPSHSSTNSPSASRTFEQRTPLPKPRPLFIDRPLAHLAAEDPLAFSLFIEGVSLLGYNIAWLCRTQGLNCDFDHWEDVCPMGRNLYRLLISQDTRAPSKPENPLDRDIAPRSNSRNSPSRASVGFGQLSHATSHSFLGTAENQAYVSGWKLTPTKISDQLKAMLLAEQQGQEWEVLDQKEWDDMENLIAEEPVVVGGKKREGPVNDARSVLVAASESARSRTPVSELEAMDSERERTKARSKGVNGWTKVKSRSEDSKLGKGSEET